MAEFMGPQDEKEREGKGQAEPDPARLVNRIDAPLKGTGKQGGREGQDEKNDMDI